MRSLVVHESMDGNTHRVDEATPELLVGVDLLVVDGPTHAHGMSRPRPHTHR